MSKQTKQTDYSIIFGIIAFAVLLISTAYVGNEDFKTRDIVHGR